MVSIVPQPLPSKLNNLQLSHLLYYIECCSRRPEAESFIGKSSLQPGRHLPPRWSFVSCRFACWETYFQQSHRTRGTFGGKNEDSGDWTWPTQDADDIAAKKELPKLSLNSQGVSVSIGRSAWSQTQYQVEFWFKYACRINATSMCIPLGC